jgi:hypothetical protein
MLNSIKDLADCIDELAAELGEDTTPIEVVGALADASLISEEEAGDLKELLK